MTFSGMVGRFRKKPVEVEAMHFDGKNGHAIQDWSGRMVLQSPVLEPTPENPSGSYLQVKTLNGIVIATPGEWIVKGVAGEFYPCSPAVFAATYELVTDGGEPEWLKQGKERLERMLTSGTRTTFGIVVGRGVAVDGSASSYMVMSEDGTLTEVAAEKVEAAVLPLPGQPS